MNAFPSLLRGPSTIDIYMERAQALKYEEQIFPREVRHLIKKLDASLQYAQATNKRGTIPGSKHSYSEVNGEVNALRSVLLAAEVVRKTREAPGISETLENRAKNQLLRAIIAL